MRIGLHSGPITGGILRGERSRFQLFGDTINTAARMESNSIRGRIQVSEQTADLLFAASKDNWLIKRDGKIDAKGKGKLQTYWLDIKGAKHGSKSDLSSGNDSTEEPTSTGKQGGPYEYNETENGISWQHAKLVNFNTDCLVRLLKQISARRAVSKEQKNGFTAETSSQNKKVTGTVRDEIEECIQLPAFNAGIERNCPMDAENIELASGVEEELREYLTEICKLYNKNNYFHNFEHATHVAMYVFTLFMNVTCFKNHTSHALFSPYRSVLKLISRIVSPLELLSKQYGSERRLNASKLYDHTYGLTSDPLTLFACAFSALIHDVDHPGVPNAQLVKEKGDLAIKYNNQSIAEQHSFDISWDLLMGDNYAQLRSAIFTNQAEQTHFRQIVINCVMATDILDPELKDLRNRQWRKAFNNALPHRSNDLDMGNRKATIVIEHLMQTSDIAHTMQHVSQIPMKR
jgi:3'5'-cyclic nucleotide phosphodiesterase/Adenylate and Guanylate cyclase catalytic domain